MHPHCCLDMHNYDVEMVALMEEVIHILIIRALFNTQWPFKVFPSKKPDFHRTVGVHEQIVGITS